MLSKQIARNAYMLYDYAYETFENFHMHTHSLKTMISLNFPCNNYFFEAKIESVVSSTRWITKTVFQIKLNKCFEI